MKRIEFRLSMPGCPSWDGKWSGSGRNYTIVHKLTNTSFTKLMGSGVERTWIHHWPDGWTAQVTARLVPTGERLKKSDGFNGYDRMVRNILDHGDIENLPGDAT